MLSSECATPELNGYNDGSPKFPVNLKFIFVFINIDIVFNEFLSKCIGWLLNK